MAGKLPLPKNPLRRDLVDCRIEQPMNPEIISYRGWDNTLRLANNDIELLVTTDVGPRILVYKTPLGENVLKTFDDQLGSSGEEEWRIRGGHRLWLAPEDATLSYHLDNGPATWRHDTFSGEVVVESIQERPQRLRKTLGILSAAQGSRVSLRHTVVNEGEPTRHARGLGPHGDAGGRRGDHPAASPG